MRSVGQFAAHARRNVALVLLALGAQWLLVLASTAHHAQALTSAGSWAQVCRSPAAVALGGDPAPGRTQAPAGASICAVCAAAIVVAPPPVSAAVLPAIDAVAARTPGARAAAVVARALPPPARAPPAA